MRSVNITVMALAAAAGAGIAAPPADVPANLASSATVTATSEYSDRYLARFVADGVVPPAGSQKDEGRAWCVRGDTHRNGAALTFVWKEPQRVAGLVYYGRTAWLENENWKVCRVFADGGTSAVARADLKSGHGPQPIPLDAPVTARTLRLEFDGSYGGLNPGASEIAIFAEPPDPKTLGVFRPFAAAVAAAAAGAEPQVAESPDLARQACEGALGFREVVAVRRHALNPSHVYTYHQEGLAPGGGLYVAAPCAPADKARELVASPEGVILDAAVSYDGLEVLFSWKRTMADKFQVFAIGVDGRGLRQVTKDDSNNFNASWLPDGGMAFLSDRKPAYAYCWVTSTPILYRCDRDGGALVRLSANYLNDFTPSVMDDGRILYSRWEYVDRPAIPIQSLWTIRADGTGLAGLFGNRVLSPATFMEARQIPGTARYLCVMTAHNGPCRGALGVIDPSLGANAQAAISNLTSEVDIGRVDAGNGNHVRGPYESPYPLDGRYFLCSRAGIIEVRDFACTVRATLLEPADGLGWYSAQPLRATAPPAPRPAHVPPPGETWAEVLVQDVYTGLAPEVRRGEIAEIAVVQEMEKSRRADVARRAFGFQFPVVSCGATYAPKKVWGFARVEADGSAHFKVPAGLPIYFMALDRDGRALQRMRSFTHLMPGERQSCIGCHADRNSVSAAHGRRCTAAAREAVPLREPEWGVRGFSYAHLVQPVLDRNCVRCHNAKNHPGELDLAGDRTDFFCVSYENLARRGTGSERWDVGGHSPADMGESPYTSWIPTYNGMESDILQVTPRAWGSPASRLSEVLLSGHPGVDGLPRIQLTPEEKRRIFAWIDLNVPYYGTPESTRPDLPGCRRMIPADLDRVLADVGRRRCAECHEGGRFARGFYTRIEHPEDNAFLLAPLAKEDGGTGACSRPVFADRNDPDYRAILSTFDALRRELAENPREDMDAPGGHRAAPACALK